MNGITKAAHGSDGVSLTLAMTMTPHRPWPTAVMAKEAAPARAIRPRFLAIWDMGFCS
jgi:hypothetical protein